MDLGGRGGGRGGSARSRERVNCNLDVMYERRLIQREIDRVREKIKQTLLKIQECKVYTLKHSNYIFEIGLASRIQKECLKLNKMY